MSHRFHIALLGGVAFLDPSGTALKLSTRKAQALLAYLATRAGAECEREKLAGLLWGDKDEDRARNSLRQTLFLLRRATGDADPQLLDINNHTVSLNPSAAEVDVRAFEPAARSGAAAELETVADLYRGDLLDGFTLDERPFEEWLLQERERLRELAVHALGRALQCQRQEGRVEAAIRTSRRLLLLEPWQEPVHRTLMRLLVEAGQPAAALWQFHQCEEALRRDLGVVPEPETRLLAATIRRQHDGQTGAPPLVSAPAPSPSASPHAPAPPLADPARGEDGRAVVVTTQRHLGLLKIHARAIHVQTQMARELVRLTRALRTTQQLALDRAMAPPPASNGSELWPGQAPLPEHRSG